MGRYRKKANSQCNGQCYIQYIKALFMCGSTSKGFIVPAFYVVHKGLVLGIKPIQSQSKQHLWPLSFWLQPRTRFPGRQPTLVIIRRQSWNPQRSLPKLWLKRSPTASEPTSMLLFPRVSRAAESSRVSAPDKCLDRRGSRLLWKQWDQTGPSKASSEIKRWQRELYFQSIYWQRWRITESWSVSIASGGFIHECHSTNRNEEPSKVRHEQWSACGGKPNIVYLCA